MFYRCYGAFSKEKLAGFLTLFERTTDVWEVLWVRVDSEYRGQGVGSSLVSKATEDTLSAGRTPMYLTTPSNIPALTMVSRLGFTFAYERCTAQITEVAVSRP
jgi:ribosomal protein S18 acetylase RimI-like enzyme